MVLVTVAPVVLVVIVVVVVTVVVSLVSTENKIQTPRLKDTSKSSYLG